MSKRDDRIAEAEARMVAAKTEQETIAAKMALEHAYKEKQKPSMPAKAGAFMFLIGCALILVIYLIVTSD